MFTIVCCAVDNAHLQVELVVQVSVNLLGIAILPEKPPQHTKSPHPQDLGWQTSLTSTPPLTYKTRPELQLTCAEPLVPGSAARLVVYRILCACPSI